MKPIILALAFLAPFSALAAEETPAEQRVQPDHPCAAFLNRQHISITRALLDCQRHSQSARPPLTAAEAGKVLLPPAPTAPEQ